ncbi:uncharacterized protein LOC119174047 isoform X2 [Rhipicephalus microplus]|uniref:uncharacterized protein LOC119174047 isoform X2 n=1 Tax=Rhipicephalus microplus TaxID=6941 RepID=UPI003F6D61E8
MPSGGPSYGSYCCVSWCFNNGRTHKKPGTSFFHIPRDGRMKAWMQYAGLSKPASLLYATYRVCSDHFTAQSFMDPGHTRLTRMAVPSVQPAAPSPPSVQKNRAFPGITSLPPPNHFAVPGMATSPPPSPRTGLREWTKDAI